MLTSLQSPILHDRQPLLTHRRSIVIGLEATRLSKLLRWHFEQMAFPGEYPVCASTAGTELTQCKLDDHFHPSQLLM
jgi:hypothetical protein